LHAGGVKEISPRWAKRSEPPGVGESWRNARRRCARRNWRFATGPARRGGSDTKRKYREAPLMERTGWWFNPRWSSSILSHHPVSGF